MAVTVKTIKKKPISLKKSGDAAEPVDGEGGAEGLPAEGAPAGGAPVKAAAGPAPKPIKKASYTFAGVCAILEFLMFSAVLTLQILEWKYYEDPPKNAFPPFGTLIPIPGGASVSSAPVVDTVDEDVPEAENADEVDASAAAPNEEAAPAE